MGIRQPLQNVLPQCGIITSVNKTTYRVKVYLPLLNTETDYIRVGSVYVGAGWGLRAMPHEGNEVLVIFPNGDLNNGIVTQIMYSEESDSPPNEGDSFSLVHESGSVLRFEKSGNVSLEATGNLTLKAGGNLTLRGARINLN